MKKLLDLKEYLPELAFVAILARILAVGCGIGEALAVISLVSSMAYTKWLTKAKLSDKEQIDAQIKTLTEDFTKQIENLNTRVNSVALQNGVRRTSNDQETTLPANSIAKRRF